MCASLLFRVSAQSQGSGTVWRSWSEWRRCHADVVPPPGGEDESQRSARIQRVIDAVNTWRARGRVPLAVDCTAQLLELNLQHGYPAKGDAAAVPPAPYSALASRHQYSLCLLRMVNGILDPQQAKHHAQSIASLAKQVHLPRILVDVRHEATHQQLPSLPLLQYASMAALEWLQRHYWHAQAHALSKTDDALRTQLRAYKKARERSAGAVGAEVAAARAARDAEMSVAVNNGDTILLLDSSNGAGAVPQSALPERAQDALKQLHSTLASGHTVTHIRSVVEGKLVPLLLSDAFMLKPPRQSRVSVSAVHRRLVETWEPAILFLAHRLRSQQINLLGLLLTSLVQRLSTASKRTPVAVPASADTWALDLAREWSLHLLQTHSAALFKEERADVSSNFSATPSKKRSHASMSASASTAPSAGQESLLDTLVHGCLKHLNPWLAPLLPLLLPPLKQIHPEHGAQIAQLERILHVTTRALYPNQQFAATSSAAKPSANAAAAVSSPDAAQTLATVREFLSSHSASRRYSTGAAASASAGASSRDGAALPTRMLDFPLVPLGLAPGGMNVEDSLWIEDDWLPASAVGSAAIAASAVATASPSVAEPVPQLTPAPSPAVAPHAAAPVVQDAPAPKRPRADTTSALLAAKLAPASAARSQDVSNNAARQLALQRLQQSWTWM